jgi:N,N'-diacetyllegionaminate synthase
MKLFGKELSRDIVVIAEVGINHEGDLSAAIKLLRLAAESGADAVKFQSYTPERYASASDPDRLARVTRFALDESEHKQLAAEAKKLGTHFFSTPLSEDWVPILDNMADAIKIASGDLTFEPVIRAAAATGKPVIVSTGLGTEAEVDTAVSWVKDEIGGRDLAEHLVIMQCVSAYPTPIEDANVRTVPYLADRYGVPIGYSNHVLGPNAALAAVALGASVIEVHFTDQKTGRTFRDHELSFEAHELRNLVTNIAAVRASLGSYDKGRQESELGALQAVRKGVVAARDLGVGEVLTSADLMFARPAVEFSAAEINNVIGRKLSAPLKRGEIIPRAGVK